MLNHATYLLHVAMTCHNNVKLGPGPLSICHTLAGMYMIPMQARTVASKSLKAGTATSRIFFRLSASDPGMVHGLLSLIDYELM